MTIARVRVASVRIASKTDACMGMAANTSARIARIPAYADTNISVGTNAAVTERITESVLDKTKRAALQTIFALMVRVGRVAGVGSVSGIGRVPIRARISAVVASTDADGGICMGTPAVTIATENGTDETAAF